MLVLYRTQATAIGGRSGCAASADRRLRLDFSDPLEAEGQSDKGTSPEQLFAMSYAASLLSAIREVAAGERITIAPDSNVTASVGIGPNDKGEGLALEIALNVDMPDVPEANARRIVDEALRRCPFCNAMRGNVEVRCSLD